MLHVAQQYYILDMIKSFKHKGLQKFYETGDTSGIQPAHNKKIRIRLTALDTAVVLEDMDLPGFRLHRLKGEMHDLRAIDVSKNWRITFKFIKGDAYIVHYEDYHS